MTSNVPNIDLIFIKLLQRIHYTRFCHTCLLLPVKSLHKWPSYSPHGMAQGTHYLLSKACVHAANINRIQFFPNITDLVPKNMLFDHFAPLRNTNIYHVHLCPQKMRQLPSYSALKHLSKGSSEWNHIFQCLHTSLASSSIVEMCPEHITGTDSSYIIYTAKITVVFITSEWHMEQACLIACLCSAQFSWVLRLFLL
jgi:hypothetical protein